MNPNQLSHETISKVNGLLKESWKAPVDKSMLPAIFKDISTSAGLTMYNLEAPAKLLLPGDTPFLNRIPRTTSQGGTSTRWRQITGYSAPANGIFAAEGDAGSKGTMTTSEVLAAYRTWVLGDEVTLQAIASAKNFDDAKAKTVTAVLLRLKVEEEILALYANPGTSGSNIGYALPSVGTTTVVQSSTGGAIGAITPSVWVMAISGFGYKHTSVATPPISLTPFHGAISTTNTGAALSGSTNSLKISWTPINGALAYAVWLGSTTTFAAGTTTLEAIVTTPDCLLVQKTGTIAGNTPGVSSSDDSAQTSPAATSGLISFYVANASTTYKKLMAADTTNFNGTALTSNNRGGIAEIDVANRTAYDSSHTGPNLIVCSGTDQERINTAAGGSAATNITNVTVSGEGGTIKLNNRVGFLTHGVTGQEQMLLPTPNAVPGTIFGITESLPYLESGVTSTVEFEMLLDYMQIDYAVTRAGGPNPDFDVFCYGTFKKYATFTDWWIQGIGD